MSKGKFDWKNLLAGLFGPLGVTQLVDTAIGNKKGSLASLWNKITGAGTTGQQDALNAFESQEAQINRDWQSQEAELNRRFQAQQAQLDYDRQVEFYEQYQSIGAQMRQYKEAGFNPALLAGGVQPASSAPSGNAPSGSMPSSSQAHSASPMSGTLGLSQFFSQVMSLLKLKSEIRVNESIANKNNSEAENTTKLTSWIDVTKSLDVEKTKQDINESKQRVDNLLADTAKKYSDIDVNNNTIEIGNQRIKLMGSQESLNETMSVLNRLKANEMSLLMPYVQARAEADYQLTIAKTDEAKASAEKALYEANVRMLEGMKEADLISGGYYDNLVTKSDWESKSVERTYKWKPINDICANISKICVGVGSVIGAVKGMPSMPMTSQVTRNTNYPDATEVPQMFWD